MGAAYTPDVFKIVLSSEYNTLSKQENRKEKIIYAKKKLHVERRNEDVGQSYCLAYNIDERIQQNTWYLDIWGRYHMDEESLLNLMSLVSGNFTFGDVQKLFHIWGCVKVMVNRKGRDGKKVKLKNRNN